MKVKIILLMGVSSCGKTTIGESLSRELAWPFFDGDSFHPPENVEKMRQGIPLNDQDRLPWLQAIRVRIDQERQRGTGAIFACSALKQSYRDILIKGVVDLVLIHLSGSPEKLRQRAEARVHQYMPASLLNSQLDTLETPEDAIVVSVDEGVEQTLAQIRRQLAQLND